MQDITSETKTFYTEIYARIEMQQPDFPDGEFAVDLLDKIRKKVFCHRESCSIVELKVNEYEGAINRDEED